MPRASTGTLRKMKSGRWQARYTFPDGVRRPAPQTFLTKRDANAWLAMMHADVSRGKWSPVEGRWRSGSRTMPRSGSRLGG